MYSAQTPPGREDCWRGHCRPKTSARRVRVAHLLSSAAVRVVGRGCSSFLCEAYEPRDAAAFHGEKTSHSKIEKVCVCVCVCVVRISQNVYKSPLLKSGHINWYQTTEAVTNKYTGKVLDPTVMFCFYRCARCDYTRFFGLHERGEQATGGRGRLLFMKYFFREI